MNDRFNQNGAGGGLRRRLFSFSSPLLLLTLVFSAGAADSDPPTPSPLPLVSGSPAPDPSASPGIASSPIPVLTSSDKRSLQREFEKAQSAEAAALRHRQAFDLKGLDASQSAQRKDWESRERVARRKFFAEHSQGAERRTYVKDFLERRRIFIQLTLEDRKKRKTEMEVRIKSLKDDQKMRLQEFKKALEKNDRPPDWLWPKTGQ